MSTSRGERGPYAKGIVKRAEILDVALGVIDQEGYNGATVKRLADAVGLSQNGLLRYFGSKENLFVEIVKHNNENVEVQVDPEHTDFTIGLATRILDAMTSSIAAAGMSKLLLSLTMAAAEEDHTAHDFIRNRYQRFRELAETALVTLQERGDFPAHASPATAAVLIAAAFDGLQTQWMYDRSVDVREHMDYLLTALGIDSPERDDDAPASVALAASNAR